jgi:hypothetical protein
MFRAMKRFWLVWAFLFGAGQSMFGFSLLGPSPGEPFQVNTIGYNLSPPAGLGTDVGTPKNLGEGYRMNTPNLYYTFDATFLDFFGSNGVAAIDQVFGIMNNTLSNVSSYSSDLHEWPLTSKRPNYRAEALGLLDVKSQTMSLLLEEMGLAEPTRWSWCLHNRFLPGGAVCPAFDYLVIERNYDPATQVYSPFVNGTLYGYNIIELCSLTVNPFAPLLADAVEYPVDPTAPSLTAVADGVETFEVGRFYTGLTRDDVGGLRYLLATNRINVETAEANSLLVVSNNAFVTTSNLSALFLAGLTNNPAALQALFPGLIIVSNSSFFTNIVTTNVVATIVNSPFAPAGSPGTVVLSNVLTTNAAQFFTYTFGNVITNSSFTQGFVTIQTISVINGVTNISNQTVFTNFFNGDFFLAPSNQCGFSIVSTQFASVIAITNFIASVTNTNAAQTFTQNLITVFTNHTLLLSVPNCVANSVSLREGIEKVHFFRQDFDSLLGQAWTPVTNIYHLTAVTNGIPVVQTLSRVTTQPDILFSAADLAPGPANPLGAPIAFLRSVPRFNQANALPGLAGPGTINLPIQFTLNKVGPSFDNIGSSFLIPNDTTQLPFFVWGSFDGTTNDPIVYPDSASLANLENEVFLQITVSGPLTNGILNQPYSTTLQATGAQPPPYTWSMPTNSPALPNGLSLGPTTGIISGTPTVTGIFDFIVQVADTAGRASERNFSIEIDP